MGTFWDRIMKRYIALFIAALIGSAMMLLYAAPASAQDEGDYADLSDEYYADTYKPKEEPYGKYDRPYLAHSYYPKHKPYYPDEKGYDGYKPYYAYASGYYKPRYPKWRKTCVYGPLREKKVCDYEPRYCWKERECYVVYGKKYCRYDTRCRGGERRCYWVKKPYYGGHSCEGPY
jgi:hypothetical protein